MIQSVGFAGFMAGLTVFLVVYAIMAPVQDIVYEQDEPVEAGVPRDGGVFEKFVRPTVRNFLPQTPLSALVKARNNSKVKELLVRSGNPWNIQPEEFFGLRILGGAAGFGVAFALVAVGLLPEMLPWPVWLAVGTATGTLVPSMLLGRHKGRRERSARQGLPEALDLLVITLGAGMNFTSALAEVVRRLPPGIIQDELTRVSAELRAGRPLSDALTDFARRAPSAEVEAFCKAVLVTERLGSDVSETLTDQSVTARQAYEAALDERTAKLSTLLFLPIITLMMPALFIVILGPAMKTVSGAF